jgi:predicted dithiol-disulfide oxidoreductase (DUF899 family)
MGWTFAWTSSLGSAFNYDFNVSFTEEQQRQGVLECNFAAWHIAPALEPSQGPVEHATMTGTDVPTYLRQMPGMSAFALEDGVIYHTYSAYARGLDAVWGMYQWLDRAAKGRNENNLGRFSRAGLVPEPTGPWWRRHDEYGAR